MRHTLLDTTTDYQSVKLSLYLQDVKILYNLCVDLLKECPDMIGYEKVMEKLKIVIEDQEKKNNKKYQKMIRRKERDFGFNY